MGLPRPTRRTRARRRRTGRLPESVPNHQAEVVSCSTLAWSRLESPDPLLLCAFRSGRAKMSPEARVKLRASDDLGRTWREVASPFGALPDAGASESGPHLGASRDGTTALMA